MFPSRPQIYGVSNNHVVANLNDCSVGDEISDPFGNTIGRLTNWFILNSPNQINYLDAALFEIDAQSSVRWQLANGLTRPNGFIDARLKGQVYMITQRGYQSGMITQVSTVQAQSFQLCHKIFLFSHLIEIVPRQSVPFSVPGESGSILFSSSNCIVGIIIGSDIDGSRSYAIPFVDGILKYYPLIIA